MATGKNKEKLIILVGKNEDVGGCRWEKLITMTMLVGQMDSTDFLNTIRSQVCRDLRGDHGSSRGLDSSTKFLISLELWPPHWPRKAIQTMDHAGGQATKVRNHAGWLIDC